MATRASPSWGALDLALAFVATAIVCAVLEVLVRGGTGLALAIALGSAGALGLVHALSWTVAIVGPARLRPRWRPIVRAAIGLVVALVLTSSLDAWDRLGTRSHTLALVAIAGSVSAGALAWAVAGWFGALDDDGAPRWLGMPARRRGVVAAVLGVGGIAAWWIDRHAFVGLHAGAHSALRAAGLAGSALAITVLFRPHARAPWDRLALVLALASTALPFVGLSGAAGPELAAVWATPLADEGVAMLRRLTDTDGDGASAWLGGGDCAPWDFDVHPAAVEIPDNGIDDNCSDGDAHVVAARIADVPVPQDPAPRSVLLVTVETLRADRMSVYGYARDTTPGLVTWAAHARVFERAFTAGAWTSIAIPSLMRGVSARRLRWEPWRETTRGRLLGPDDALELVGDERPLQVFMLPAAGGPPPLAWWLQRRGMTTAAVVDDRFSELLDPSVGTAIGFDRFVDADEIRGRDPDDRVVDRAIEVLHSLPADRPFFLWVHLFGPHSPNTLHEGVPTFGETLGDGYDHEIRFVDAHIDRLLAAATTSRPALVWIVTADHGEALLADDRRHGFDLSAPVIRVPLLLGGDGVSALGRVDEPVSALDLCPTILALTETPAPPWLDGIDLVAEVPASRVLLVDTWHRDGEGALLFDQVAATDGRIELIFERTKNAWGLADLADESRTPEQILTAFDPAPWRATIRTYLEAGPLAIDDAVPP